QHADHLGAQRQPPARPRADHERAFRDATPRRGASARRREGHGAGWHGGQRKLFIRKVTLPHLIRFKRPRDQPIQGGRGFLMRVVAMTLLVAAVACKGGAGGPLGKVEGKSSGGPAPAAPAPAPAPETEKATPPTEVSGAFLYCA